MNVLDLFNTDYERNLTEGAVDTLEQRRIDDLNMKMDELANRVKSTTDKAHRESLLKAFLKCKEERDSYYKIKEGEVTRTATGIKHRSTDAYGGTQDEPDHLARLDKHAVNRADKALGVKFDREKKYQGGLDIDEAGIGQDIADKAEKIARATPSTPAGKVTSTVKNAAKWLAGKGGPGKEGPTYEGAEDIADRGEYDQEGDMVKDNLHTIRREADRLEKILADNENVPEWVQDKLAQVKGMLTASSEYMQTQHERDHEEVSGEEGVAIAEWKKETPWKEIPKSKSGKPVDPRGEVTHLSDVARREAERKGQAQKKNSKEVTEGQRLHIGDPIIVTAPNKFEGKTGEIAEFSPSGKFIIVNLYNHGEQPMHLSDVEYNQYADQEDEVDEGWSDAIVSQRTGRSRTPYSVYIKGKKWRDFENDDHAEAVANKLRAKFKADGRDPSVITIAPTDYNKGMAEAISKKDLLSKVSKDLNTPFKKAKAGKLKSDGKDFTKGDHWQGAKPGDYGYTGYQGHGMPTDKAERDRIRADKKKGVAENTGNLKSELADVYRKLAPGIERYKDSFLAGQLYDALEAVADKHNAHREFTRIIGGAKNRAHMEYDTNPGGFQNWFWFLPFADEELTEFAPGNGDEGEEDTLLKFARLWWNGNEATQDKVEQVLAKMGWTIGENESGDENDACFVVRDGDMNGDSYIAFGPDNLAESYMESVKSKGITDKKLLEAAARIDRFAKSFK